MAQTQMGVATLGGDLDDELLPNSQQTQRTSALSNKLASVLSASFADSEIREALTELDERHVQTSAESRRSLRTELQKDLIEANGDIIKDFGQIAAHLKQIGETIDALGQYCDDMRARITSAQRETAPVLEEATTLVRQQDEVEAKQKLLAAFNSHFNLDEKDIEVLTSSAQPVNDQFFSLLTRLKRIYADCEVLLESDDQNLGTELLERTSKHLDQAFQKLFRWIQKEFKALDLENPRMSIPIRRALRVLAERPSLFEACLDSFAEARERNLSEAFYAALTGFSTQTDDRTARPMDYFAHDSLRFVGDMLAWTHSAAVSERESLEVLFIREGDEMAAGIRAGLESEPWRQADGPRQPFDGKMALEDLVNRDMAGVARALKQRIDQVVKSDEDAVLAYKAAHLVDFYRLTFDRIMGSDSAVIRVLTEIHEAAMAQFRSLMEEHARALPRSGAGSLFSAPADLSPPEFLLEAVERLQQVMTSFDASFTASEARESSFKETLALCLDPYLEACKVLVSDSDSPLREPASNIFTLNTMKSVLPALSRFDFTESRHDELQDQIRKEQNRLVDHQYSYFLQSSGIKPLYDILIQLSPDDTTDMAQVPQLDVCKPTTLAATSQMLDEFLPDALVEAQEELTLLQDKSSAEAATSEAAARFCEDFDKIEERLMAADEMAWSERDGSSGRNIQDSAEDINGDRRRLRDLFPRTGAEIRVLLS